GRNVLGEMLRGAHPAAYLAVFLPAGEQPAVGDGQLVGTFLAQLHIEGAAVATDAAVERLQVAAIRGLDRQLRGRARTHAGRAAGRRLVECADAGDTQGKVLEVEQIVGDGCIDG